MERERESGRERKRESLTIVQTNVIFMEISMHILFLSYGLHSSGMFRGAGW